MNTMLINATHPEELRVALTKNNKLYDLDIERPGFASKISNIYKGRITSLEPSLGAAFVDFGSTRHGFLPIKEIAREYFITQDLEKLERPNIKEVLREGQEIIVQVEKEERGNKGAALTTFVSLAGSYLVLIPNNPRSGGISRRIEGEEREELRTILSQLHIPEDMGLIVRTAGVGKSQDELQWDLNFLIKHWAAIKVAYNERPAPFLIHQESDIVIRTIRDHMSKDTTDIIIDDPEVFARAKLYLDQARPDFVDRLKLYQDKVPLFTRYRVEHQIETAFQREVNLPSGASIVIDPCEALVAIDINSAKATKGSGIEETAFNINLEAAEEIARQLRFRDIGGLIVIDFIDMIPIKHQREVENRLREALKIDRARVQIGRISRFGLLEMSRQRLRPALTEANQILCPRCHGQGTIRGVESLTLSIIRLLDEEASTIDTAQVQVQLPIEIATFLLNEKRDAINSIEKRQQVKIVILPNPHLETPQYKIRRLRETEGSKISYKLLETPEIEIPNTKAATERPQEEPAVKTMLPTEPLPVSAIKKPPRPSLIKRLWQSMFGKDSEIKLSTAAQKPEYASSEPYRRPRTRKPQGYNGRTRRPRSRDEGDSYKARQFQGSSNRRRPESTSSNFPVVRDEKSSVTTLPPEKAEKKVEDN